VSREQFTYPVIKAHVEHDGSHYWSAYAAHPGAVTWGLGWLAAVVEMMTHSLCELVPADVAAKATWFVDVALPLEPTP
jgi:hypothetical protein